jgi:hypothetical protein
MSKDKELVQPKILVLEFQRPVRLVVTSGLEMTNKSKGADDIWDCIYLEFRTSVNKVNGFGNNMHIVYLWLSPSPSSPEAAA